MSDHGWTVGKPMTRAEREAYAAKCFASYAARYAKPSVMIMSPSLFDACLADMDKARRNAVPLPERAREDVGQ